MDTVGGVMSILWRVMSIMDTVGGVMSIMNMETNCWLIFALNSVAKCLVTHDDDGTTTSVLYIIKKIE